jgi:hypothetical protein
LKGLLLVLLFLSSIFPPIAAQASAHAGAIAVEMQIDRTTYGTITVEAKTDRSSYSTGDSVVVSAKVNVPSTPPSTPAAIRLVFSTPSGSQNRDVANQGYNVWTNYTVTGVTANAGNYTVIVQATVENQKYLSSSVTYSAGSAPPVDYWVYYVVIIVAVIVVIVVAVVAYLATRSRPSYQYPYPPPYPPPYQGS